jgi:para-nitrobenzyl esterase
MARAAVVETPAGALRGRSSTAGDSFVGIPYAQARRFAAPEPVPAWSEVREATIAGPVAPQPRRPLGEFSHGPLPAASESCLNLNVWTPPTGAAGLRPVLVWIHGGGFALGAGSADIYDGARLAAAAGIVVVTLNYRLGSLGWLYHPDLAKAPGAPAGNWGLLDQIAALEWVRDSIEAFGGDPSRVTLAGQSAGALSALDLLVVPRANGLFQRAILQSPPFGDVAGDPAFARRWAEALGRSAGAAEGFDVGALRRLAAVDIVGLHEALLGDPGFRGTRGGALPTLDPGSLPVSPALRPGASLAVDVLIGSTADEATFFFRAAGRRLEPDDATLVAIVSHFPGVDDASTLIDTYRHRLGGVDANELLVRIATDAMIASPAARWASARATAGGSVHRYRVDHSGDPDLGATHTVDVPLVFGTYNDGGAGTRLAGAGGASAAVSSAMMESWGRFVHEGEPGWPAVEAGRDVAVAVFGGAAGTRQVELSSDDDVIARAHT